MYYRECPRCGAHIDPGETCDCRMETKKEAVPMQRERPQAKSPTASVTAGGREVKYTGRRGYVQS